MTLSPPRDIRVPPGVVGIRHTPKTGGMALLDALGELQASLQLRLRVLLARLGI